MKKIILVLTVCIVCLSSGIVASAATKLEHGFSGTVKYFTELESSFESKDTKANYGAAVFTEYDPNYIELKVWIEKANNGNNLTNKVSVPTKLNSVIKMKFKDVSKAYNKSTKLNVDQVSNIGGIVAVTGTWTPDYSSYK